MLTIAVDPNPLTKSSSATANSNKEWHTNSYLVLGWTCNYSNNETQREQSPSSFCLSPWVQRAELMNTRNTITCGKIKLSLDTHFGDQRDLIALIVDLRRIKQLSFNNIRFKTLGLLCKNAWRTKNNLCVIVL